MLHNAVGLNRQTHYLSLFRRALITDSKMTDDDWEDIKNNITFKTAEQNTLLLEHRTVENSVRFLLNGVVKVVYFDLDPYVFDFRTGGDYLCDTGSLLKQHKSDFSFETLTPCEWIQIDSAVFSELIKRNAGLRISMLMKVAEYAQRANEKAALIRNFSAEERYLKFCDLHPQVIKCAKISDVASYLSITPQSLSRIRKNLV